MAKTFVGKHIILKNTITRIIHFFSFITFSPLNVQEYIRLYPDPYIAWKAEVSRSLPLSDTVFLVVCIKGGWKKLRRTALLKPLPLQKIFIGFDANWST